MYKVSITETSAELTAREKLMMEDTTNAVRLNDIEGELTITPKAYAILHGEDDEGENDPYDKIIITDEEGQKYTTGSKAFRDNFLKIWNTMAEENEPYQIKIYKVKSNKREGSFITCCII
jgi:hypothetical protein